MLCAAFSAAMPVNERRIAQKAAHHNFPVLWRGRRCSTKSLCCIGTGRSVSALHIPKRWPSEIPCLGALCNLHVDMLYHRDPRHPPYLPVYLLIPPLHKTQAPVPVCALRLAQTRSASSAVEDTPARGLARATDASVDQTVVGSAFGDQIPAAHPLVGALKLLHRIWSWLDIAQSGQMEVLRGDHGLMFR
jgi:hypothetical protein